MDPAPAEPGHPGGAGPTEVESTVLPNSTSVTEIASPEMHRGQSTGPQTPFNFCELKVKAMVFGYAKSSRGRGRPPRPADNSNEPSKSWDFTDPKLAVEGKLDPERFATWERWTIPPAGCVYLEIALECSDKGYWHGQGRLVTRRAYRLTQLTKLVPGVHWERTKASADCLYLRKHGQETVLLYNSNAQGKRVVFEDFRNALANGASLREISQMQGACTQSMRSAELMAGRFEPERPLAPRNVILVPNNATPMPVGTYRVACARWWDLYDRETDIYINQAVLKLSLPLLKQYIGPAPFRIGRGRQAVWDTVYISGLDDDDRRALNIPSLPARDPWSILVR